jgi:hypothetical protein
MDKHYLNRLMDDVELADEPFNITEGILIACAIGLALWAAGLAWVFV